MRERPEEERRVLAGGVALATVAILFVGWGFSFVQGLGGGAGVVAQDAGQPPAANTASVQTSQVGSQVATPTPPRATTPIF